MSTTIRAAFATIFLFLTIASCTEDSDQIIIEQPPTEASPPPPVEVQDSIITQGDTGEVILFRDDKVSDGLLLINDAGNNRVYLMDHSGVIKHEWDLEYGIGNDAYLLEDGNLLVALMGPKPEFTFGGYGGIIRLLNKSSEILWEYTLSDENQLLHHDLELLPNGNILAMVWERIPLDVTSVNGVTHNASDLFSEALIEIDFNTKEIVWEWHAWDHIVQDVNPEQPNYGNVQENFHRININYFQEEKGDVMHANGIAFDEFRDLIYLSVNFYNEVWVIDHSTTTETAKSNSGGNFGRGGDIIYRFGNSKVFGGTGIPQFNRNHFPNFSDLEKTTMLVFSNNIETEKSVVYELDLPTASYGSEVTKEPAILWQFEHKDLFAPKVSGAARLPNGNTLITEGDYGIWEVTSEGEIVWKFTGDGFYWRTYHYEAQDPAIMAMGL